MLRTVVIKLKTTAEDERKLVDLRQEYSKVCNMVSPIAHEKQCTNKIELHHLAYYKVRHDKSVRLGSQMACNVMRSVATGYRVQKVLRAQALPVIVFRPNMSIHYDKNTFSFKDDQTLSLYTLEKRIKVTMDLGDYQREMLAQGKIKEAELKCRDGIWYLHLVIEYDPVLPLPLSKILGVDTGENNLAAISSGKLFGGGKLRFDRDNFLALRSRLQSNGSKSAKQRLRKISGKEARHMRHINHCISKAIIQEALDTGCGIIALENLTNIRKRIKAKKRMRARLHRWAWAQLQEFIVYKAEAAGLRVIFVNPAYTSKTCSECGKLGERSRHRFACKFCGIQRHSDLNASQNIRKIAESADLATGDVNHPHVATKR